MNAKQADIISEVLKEPKRAKKKHPAWPQHIAARDYAAELMGWENKFHCEKETFCNTILNYYWPNAISYEDIKTTDFTIHRGTIDVLTGGFPCQPYSVAGKRKGKDDERHLWPEMCRAIREIQPRWVVGENVRGLINWNGGVVFDEVQADLEAEGYEVLPFILPAAGVNAPHRRDRIWFVAHRYRAGLEAERTEQQAARIEQHGELGGVTTDTPSIGRWENTKTGMGVSRGLLQDRKREEGSIKPVSTRQRSDVTNTEGIRQEQPWHSRSRRSGSKNDSTRDVTNTSSTRRKKFDIPEKSDEQRYGSGGDNAKRVISDTYKVGLQIGYAKSGWSIFERQNSIQNWENFPTQPPVRLRNDGISAGLSGITFSSWRKESIEALGNAIVPQVVLQIFRAIEQYYNIKS